MDDQVARLIIEALEDVAAFSEDDLNGAPLIDEWTVTGDAVPSLIGRVTGHPTIRDGRRAQTSALIAMSERDGWARTLNRYYRLGRPLGTRHVH